ncbi:hypothetical protein BH20ACT16_BH20ACT16_10420 [soil metagenome]
MKKTYYSAKDLRGSLDAFEAHYGLSSRDFFHAYSARDGAYSARYETRIADVPGSHRFSWATFYAEWSRIDDASIGLGGRIDTH